MKKLHILTKVPTGFTITETLVAVSIVGILAAISIPNYTKQLCRSKASEAETTISSIMAIKGAYSDETGALPQNWDDLNSITTVMSSQGPMSGNFTIPLTSPSANYEITVSGPSSTQYDISAIPMKGCKNWDLKACINLGTGASAISRGDGTSSASTPICS